MKTFCILFQISLKFVPDGATYTKLALVQVIVLNGDELLPDTMMTKLCEAILGCQATMS